MWDVLVNAVSALAGVIVGFLLQSFYERHSRARLELDDEFYLEPFEHSARVGIRVKHVGGRLPATNIMGQLTAKVHGGKLSEIAIGKVNGKCKLENLCGGCGGKTYLASEKAEIRDEALPWSLPINAGVGLGNLKYAYLTHIPVSGSSMLRLFDIYRVRVYGPYVRGKPPELEDEFWLVKVHSEYGVRYCPRICLRLPVKGNDVDIHFIIKLAGENVRGSVQSRVIVRLKEGNCTIEYGKKRYPLSEYFEDKDIEPLELQPKGRIY